MTSTGVGRRGRVTLPRAIRREYHIEEGDRIVFVRKRDEIVIQPLRGTLSDLRGSVPVSGPQDLPAVRREVIKTRVEQSATIHVD